MTKYEETKRIMKGLDFRTFDKIRDTHADTLTLDKKKKEEAEKRLALLLAKEGLTLKDFKLWAF